MSVWGRLRAVISGRIEQTLDRADDPIAALDRALEAQNALLFRARESVVEVLTAEKRLQIEMSGLTAAERRQREDAQIAFTGGNETHARAALARASGSRLGAESMERHIAELRTERAELEAAVETLRQRVESFRIQKVALQARHGASRAGAAIGESLTGVSADGAEIERTVDRAREASVALRARSAALLELAAGNSVDPAGALGDEAADVRIRAAAIQRDVERAINEMRRKALPGTGAAPNSP